MLFWRNIQIHFGNNVVLRKMNNWTWYENRLNYLPHMLRNHIWKIASDSLLLSNLSWALNSGNARTTRRLQKNVARSEQNMHHIRKDPHRHRMQIETVMWHLPSSVINILTLVHQTCCLIMRFSHHPTSEWFWHSCHFRLSERKVSGKVKEVRPMFIHG